MYLAEEQAKLLAAALFEIRVLLQTYRGDDVDVRLAERLAYALHEVALRVVEGEPNFDVAAARRRIEILESMAGGKLPDGFGILTKRME